MPYHQSNPQNDSAFLTNLDGATLNLVHYGNHWITGHADPVSGLLSGGGLTEGIIRDMQKNLNFRINLTTLGDKDPSGSDYFESGIGQLLDNGTADLAIEYLFLTIPRATVASSLHPIFTDRLFALFVQPHSSDVRNIYLDPLQPSVWMAWFLAIFSIFCVTNILTNRKNCRRKLQSFVNVIIESCFATVASISQTGYIGQNMMTSVLPLTISSSILSMGIYLVFGAQLLAVILRPTYPIKNVKDLIDHGYSFYSSPPLKSHFVQNERFTLPKMNQGQFQSSDAFSISMRAIFKEKHARLDVGIDSAGGTLWYGRLSEIEESEHDFCTKVSSIKMSKSHIDVAVVFYVSKNSNRRNLLNKSILRIKETGLTNRYLNHPTLPRLRCSPSVKSSYDENLGLKDVSFAFILFWILAIFSQLSLLCEILWDWWKTLSYLCFKLGRVYYNWRGIVEEDCDLICL